MSTGQLSEAEAVEACVEALDEATGMLAHHPPRALAAALAMHLQGLLAVLHSQHELSTEQIWGLLEDVAQGASLGSA